VGTKQVGCQQGAGASCEDLRDHRSVEDGGGKALPHEVALKGGLDLGSHTWAGTSPLLKRE